MASTASRTNQAERAKSAIDKPGHYRWQELGLLIIPFMILLLEMFQLILVTTADPQSMLTSKSLPAVQSLIPALGVIAALLGVNIFLSIFYRKADQMLLPLVGLLSGLSVLMSTRLGPDITPPQPSLGSHQLLWVLLGLAICIITVTVLRNMEWLSRYKYSIALLGVVLVGVTLVHSLHANLNSPTHDQLNIGPLNFQPSELLKICIVIFFAAYLSENLNMVAKGNLRLGNLRLPPLRQLIPLLLMLMLALVIFLGIRELGLALLIYGIFLCMIYLGSGRMTYVLSSLGLFIVFGLIGYLLFGYVRARFAVVSTNVVNWNAHSEALYSEPGGAFQVVQGLIALSSGGILGAGLGLGAPTFVPVVQSDMIFTALGEEFGLVGLFAIIGIYLFIIYRGYRIAMEATTTFNQLLAAGLTSIFALQTLIIAAGNMNFLPLTGIPLPFLSYGGSSMVGNYIIIGILLRISYNTAREREGLV